MPQQTRQSNCEKFVDATGATILRAVRLIVTLTISMAGSISYSMGDNNLRELAEKYTGLYASELPAQIFDKTFALRAIYKPKSPKYDDERQLIAIDAYDFFMYGDMVKVPEVCVKTGSGVGRTSQGSYKFDKVRCENFLIFTEGAAQIEKNGLPDEFTFRGPPQSFRDIRAHGIDAEIQLMLVRSSSNPILEIHDSSSFAEPILRLERKTRIYAIQGVVKKVSLFLPAGESLVLFDADKQKAALSERGRLSQGSDKHEQSAGPQQHKFIDDWKMRIQAKIKSRVVVPPNIAGNPEARFEIVLLPGGEVLSASLKKSSGYPAYDAAVERAISAAQPLPVPANTDLFQENFRELDLIIRPKD